MNLTIIFEDNSVYLDGFVLVGLDFSSAQAPENVKCLQWKSNVGWVEYKTDSEEFEKQEAQIIYAIPEWANKCVTIFKNQVKSNKEEAHIKQLELAKNQPHVSGALII